MTLKQGKIMTNIKAILKDIKPRINTNRNLFLHNCIKERLDSSLKQYKYQLDKAYENLTLYSEEHSIELLRKINKEDKNGKNDR